MVFWGELPGPQCGGIKGPGWLLGVSEFEVTWAETSDLGGERRNIILIVLKALVSPGRVCGSTRPKMKARSEIPFAAVQQLVTQSLLGRFRKQIHQTGKMCVLDSKTSHVSERSSNKEVLDEHQVFPGGAVDGNPPADAGDKGSIPGPGRFHMLWSSWACVPQLLSLGCATRETTEGQARALKGRVAPTPCNKIKPARSSEDPARPKINQSI